MGTKICRFLILFLIPAVALMIWHGNITAIEIKDFVVQLTCLTILCVSLLQGVFSNRIRIRKDPLVGIVAVYGTLMLVGYALSNRSSLNTKALVPQIYGVITFLLVIHHFSKKDIGAVTFLFMLTGAAASLYAGAQLLGLDPLNWMIPDYNKRGAIVSTFGHKNYFALFLLLSIPMGGIFAILAGRISTKVAGGVSIAVMIAGLIISNSRGGIVAFFTSILIMAIVYSLRRFKTVIKKIKALTLCIVVLFVVFLTIVFLPGKMRREFSTLDQAAGARMEYYRAGSEIIGRHPGFGAGPGNFVIAYPMNETHKTLTHDPNKVLLHVHNDFLETGVEYGLWGLLAYCSMIGLFYFRWTHSFLKTDDPKAQLLLVCAASAITGYLLYSFFTVAGRYMSSTFNFYLVLGVGYLLTEREADPVNYLQFKNPIKRLFWLSIPLALCILTLFGMGIEQTVKSYRSDAYLKRAAVYSSKGRHDPALWYLNRALSLRPNSVEAYYQRGFVNFQKNAIDSALGDYKKVHTLAPNYVNVAFNTASCYYRKRDWINAIGMAELSHRSFPDYEPPLLMLANCYYYIRQPRKALYYCNRLIEKPGRQPKAERLKKRLEKILR